MCFSYNTRRTGCIKPSSRNPPGGLRCQQDVASRPQALDEHIKHSFNLHLPLRVPSECRLFNRPVYNGRIEGTTHHVTVWKVSKRRQCRPVLVTCYIFQTDTRTRSTRCSEGVAQHTFHTSETTSYPALCQ